jgi:hypothetical protein
MGEGFLYFERRDKPAAGMEMRVLPESASTQRRVCDPDRALLLYTCSAGEVSRSLQPITFNRNSTASFQRFFGVGMCLALEEAQATTWTRGKVASESLNVLPTPEREKRQ